MSRCFECGDAPTEEHHVVPRSRGGTRTVALCGRCHGLVHDFRRRRSDDHARLTREALARAAANGVRLGGQPHPQREELEVLCRELRKTMSYRKVAEELVRRGYKPLRGKTWAAASIYRFVHGRRDAFVREARTALSAGDET